MFDAKLIAIRINCIDTIIRIETEMDTLWPLVSFAFASSITPGPNNLMLASSGVAFGLRRTLPHTLGVSTGFATLLIIAGAGIGALVANAPAAALGLKIFGTGYLAYLAWIMRHAFDGRPTDATARPIRFVEAALFQFANPKAWVMALTAMSVFMPADAERWAGVLLVSGVFVLVGLPCILSWVALGVTVRRSLKNERRRRIFAAAIFVLMLYTIVAIWI